MQVEREPFDLGAEPALEGEIFFDGQASRFARPIDARGHGIETIYQDLALADNLDVGANIFLGRELPNRCLGCLVRRSTSRRMRREARGRLDALEIHPEADPPVDSLSGGQRQAVAIARAVYWNAKLMIMDEPTDTLGVPSSARCWS